MTIVKTELVFADVWIYHRQPVLHLTYHIAYNDGSVDELDIPAIDLSNGQLPELNVEYTIAFESEATVDFGALRLLPCQGRVWTQKNIIPAVKKMTVAEIEKELGHRVEIISEEATDDD